MIPKNQGSLLWQITSAPKGTKRVRGDRFKNDDITVSENTNFQMQNDVISNIGNQMPFESEKSQEAQIKSDSIKSNTNEAYTSSDEEDSHEFPNVQPSNFQKRYKSQLNISAKTEKKSEILNKSHIRKLVGPTPKKVSNDDSAIKNLVSHMRVPKSSFSIPEISRNSKQRSSSNATVNELKQKDELHPTFIFEENTQTQNSYFNQSDNYIPKEEFIKNEDIIKKVTEPIRRRLIVKLPNKDFQIRHIQVTTALDMIDQDVDEISKNVAQVHESIYQLSQGAREISEKSMDLTQTSEAVLSKVNVMTDWIDGLEKVGSGLKMQFIELIVKFVSFLSSLLLLIYQTIRKANPLALFRNKKKKKPPLIMIGNDENI